MSEKALNSILIVLSVLTVGVLTLYASSNCRQAESEATATPSRAVGAVASGTPPIPTATLPALTPTPFHTAVIVTPITPEPTRTPLSTPTPTGTPVPSPTTGPSTDIEATVYVVQPGDTLYSIARRYGVSVDDLVAINDIEDPTRIKVGQELAIPLYVVKKGDTLYSIAKRFGVTTEALAAANNIDDPNDIKVGQNLIIPSGAVPPPPASPTATSSPTHTPTPSPTVPIAPTPSHDFVLEQMIPISNCGLTQIWGYIHDAAGNGLPGYTVKVTTADGGWSAISNPSAGDGYYDLILATEPKALRWHVVVVADGRNLSPIVEVETTATDCAPGGSGVQTPRLDFKRRW